MYVNFHMEKTDTVARFFFKMKIKEKPEMRVGI